MLDYARKAEMHNGSSEKLHSISCKSFSTQFCFRDFKCKCYEGHRSKAVKPPRRQKNAVPASSFRCMHGAFSRWSKSSTFMLKLLSSAQKPPRQPPPLRLSLVVVIYVAAQQTSRVGQSKVRRARFPQPLPRLWHQLARFSLQRRSVTWPADLHSCSEMPCPLPVRRWVLQQLHQTFERCSSYTKHFSITARDVIEEKF